MPLNEPIGYEPGAADDWTPQRGLARAVLHAGLAAGLIGVLLGVLAVVAPPIVIMSGMRTPIAFGLVWLLAMIAERAAGMSGGVCTLLAAGLTAALLLSHHVIWAVAGIAPVTLGIGSWLLFPMVVIEPLFGDSPGGSMAGWRWFHPYVLLAVNVLPALGAGFSVMLRRG